jgi:YbgC/YbaW family acyl-CoA thioester hydrolase
MFKISTNVNFFDTDPGGIIFYANLFKIMHIAYEKFLSLVESGTDYFQHKEIILPIVHSEADFLSPIRVHQNLSIEIMVTQLKKSSFELSYKIWDEDLNLKALGKTVHVSVNKSTFNKIELPLDLKELFLQHME